MGFNSFVVDVYSALSEKFEAATAVLITLYFALDHLISPFLERLSKSKSYSHFICGCRVERSNEFLYPRLF